MVIDRRNPPVITREVGTMFLVIFKFANGDTPNYVGLFDNYKEADYFKQQWAHTFTKDKGEMSIVRVDKPKTPSECRLPAYAK